ncbi:serine/threonine phosphatase [Cyanobacterium aponinum UTEX 3222]|uniref:serine/threonine phosphatase n=1 Tax=Cyanobacterium aponinum TaxID=379064 RepID=UPI00308DDFBA|nr:serine/threonine phosphatase [Cyanobacterium aponinum UTEX 3222]
MSDFDTTIYKCIISIPADKTPYIPFKTVQETKGQSSSKYALVNPLELSSLTPYIKINNRQYFALEVVDINPEQKSILDENLEKIEDFEKDNLKKVGIPDLAFIYLTLTEYNPTVPELLDAWQDSQLDQEVVIVTNNQIFKTLTEYWQNNTPDKGTILGYLQTMTKLWRTLSKLNCRSTLLHINNLKIDFNQTLLIEHIYQDSDNDPPLLRELVETWANLIADFGEDYESLITDLMIKIESGEVEDAKQLRSEIELLIQQAEIESLLEEEDLSFLGESDELNTIAESFGDDELSSESQATQINSDGDDQPTLVLPMRLLSVKEVGLTDIGRRRGHNEDYFAMDTTIKKSESSRGTYVSAKGLFLVCDGMGGHAGGEVASATAVKCLSEYFQQNWGDELPSAQTIREGILNANETIYSLNKDKGQVGAGRMGTTLTLTLVQDTKAAIAHVGDSRIYRVTRKWGLELLTVDHCVAQAEIRQGVDPEIAYARPDAYQLTQALGPRDNSFVNPDIRFLDIKEDTLFLMCSDGLYDNDLFESNWEKILLPLISSKANLEEGVAHIIDLGNQVNGHDNLTCVLVRIKVQPNLDGQSGLF